MVKSVNAAKALSAFLCSLADYFFGYRLAPFVVKSVNAAKALSAFLCSFADYFFGYRLRHFCVVVELHGELSASLRSGT